MSAGNTPAGVHHDEDLQLGIPFPSYGPAPQTALTSYAFPLPVLILDEPTMDGLPRIAYHGSMGGVA
jgi:hypothetical protein